MKAIRIGNGYDVHRLVPGRKLILGGVEIPHDKGLMGHSDADALLHAITDALLGALALGDIGKHFPDTDPALKDADSRELLRLSYQKILDKGFVLGNIDATIILEKPKLLPYIMQMREQIAEDLTCPVDAVSVKATTSETLGFVGREEGIAVLAVALIYKS